MKTFLFGFDIEHPRDCAAHLKSRGIDAVVVGAPTRETQEALAAQGIDLYLSCGAYSVKAGERPLAQDAHGAQRLWFHSGCPNDHINASARMEAALERARTFESVKGILVDGARFASFASVEGIEPFFTCFCPNCMQAMKADGLDAEGIRQAVSRLAVQRTVNPADAGLIRDWFSFRERTVQRYMDRFASAVHSVRGGLLAGAFIFAPSLGAFVGQTAQACRSLDIVSHMLYRAYPHKDGVACLGHEWAALIRAFGAGTSGLIQAANAPFEVDSTPEALLSGGFEPGWIGREVALARQSCGSEQLLWPIVQIEDDRLDEAVHHALHNGADAAGYFSYGDAPLP